jgi:uncharacterized membrane protein YjgN (DUF898 family)
MSDPGNVGVRAEGLHFAQLGGTGKFVGLSLRVFLLSLVTLSLYRYWGRTEIRRALWGSTVIDGEPLDYMGTGLELFIGALLAVLTYVLPLSAIAWLVLQLAPPSTGTPGYPDPSLMAVYGVGFLAFLYLTPVALYQALRYRLSRTQWRGVRFSLDGSAFAFGLRFLGLGLLNIILAGWLTPFMDVALFRVIANRTYFGDKPFRFEGKSRPLYGPFAIGYLLAGFALAAPVISAGLKAGQTDSLVGILALCGVAASILTLAFVPIYIAARLRILGSGLRFQGLSFHLDARTWSYFWLMISNWLIVSATIGILTPVSELRRFHYIFRRLSATGPLDLGSIGPSKGPRPRFGEGLAEVFGLGNV